MLNQAIEGTQVRRINFLTNPWVHEQSSAYSHINRNSHFQYLFNKCEKYIIFQKHVSMLDLKTQGSQ